MTRQSQPSLASIPPLTAEFGPASRQPHVVPPKSYSPIRRSVRALRACRLRRGPRSSAWATALQTLVSVEETAKNLAALRRFGATQTKARWVWITPATVIEEKIPAHWFLGPLELAWSNRDLRAVADVVCRQPDTAVNVQALLGIPA